jgi:hypothetical protein
MPSQNCTPRTWEEVAEAASKEKDPIKLATLVEELSDVLSQKHTNSTDNSGRPPS